MDHARVYLAGRGRVGLSQRVKLDFTLPGKTTDNANIVSFNGKFRLECLNQNWFASLEDAQSKIEAWKRDYNWERPHSSFGNHTPRAFVQSWGPTKPIPLIAIGLKS